MKPANLLIAFLISYCSFGQSANETTIQVKLYLPSHIKNDLTAADKLSVYFIKLLDDSIQVPKKIIAKRIQENVYEFNLPNTKFWHIGFSIGNYHYQMLCLDNRKGDAEENYTFNILLQRGKFESPKLLPPCIRTDDDE